MKKSKVEYEDIVSYDVIEENIKGIYRNTKHKDKLIRFDMFHSVNVTNLYNVLKRREYKHGKFNIFLIREPKYRIVMSEGISDKIVNHIVSNVFLKPVLYPKLIEENVATRVGKGTAAAIEYCKKYFVRMMNKYENFYILKFDIAKYFYNIDHQILKDMLRDIYEDDDVFEIIACIIDATDDEGINREIEKCIEIEKSRLSMSKSKEAQKAFESLDSIPHYHKGKGLGIGSLTSQILAIFYLDSLDHYIKETLGIKEYVRFMDDGIIFHHDRNELKRIYNLLKEKIENLNLRLNDKTRIYSSSEGLEFVGYRFLKRNGRLVVRIKNGTKNKMKKKFKVLADKNEEKLVGVRASYKGFLQYCTVKSLYRKYYDD